MGISKKNPRGNFNWQYRYLKRNPKGECCGVPEPDCGQFAPAIALTSPVYYCINKTSITPFNMVVVNSQPSLIAVTTTYQWYFNGNLVYTSGPSSTSIYNIPNGTKLNAGIYEVVATNSLGCKTTLEFELYVFDTPDFSPVVVDSTYLGGENWLCVADPLIPSGSKGTGSITLFVNFPDASRLYYRYKINYGPSTPNYQFTDQQDTINPIYAFTQLCNGDYTITVELWADVNGVATNACSVTQVVHVGPLILGWDDIANVPVANPADPTQWQYAFTFSNLVVNSATVNGNRVFLKFAPSGVPVSPYTTFQTAAFLGNSNLTSINDQGGWVNRVFNQAFQSCINLDFVKLYSCISIGESGFYDTGTFQAVFPVCTQIGQNGFAISKITQAVFARLTKMNDGYEFFSTVNLSSYSFPVLSLMDGVFCFNGSSIPNIDFPLLSIINGPTVSGNQFSLCTNATYINLPNCGFIYGSSVFVNCTAVTSINIPNVGQIGDSVGNDFIFQGIIGNTIAITAETSLQTINAGGLEGDLAYLNTNNTVTFTWV